METATVTSPSDKASTLQASFGRAIGREGGAERYCRALFLFWLLLWGIANLLTLSRFPYVHSDEVWLAGLSNAIRDAGTLRITEPFFDLFPRQPHLLKALYHLLQAPLLALPGPAIFWARLPSLLAATGTLIVIRRLLIRSRGEGLFPLLVAVALSLHPQFLYAAHFGRQESLLLLALASALLLYEKTVNTAWFALTPLLIGVSALLHPNAFLLAAILGARLLFAVLGRRVRPGQMFVFLGVLLPAALLLAGGSLLLNPAFLTDYRTFGASLSVDAVPSARWQNFLDYFVKLFARISGTYWLPDIRVWLLVTAVCVGIGVLLQLRFLRRKPRQASTFQDEVGDLLAEGLGFLAGMIVIGRFNPTAIVFALPFSLRLAATLLHQGWTGGPVHWFRRACLAAGLVLVLLTAVAGVSAVSPFLASSTAAPPVGMTSAVDNPSSLTPRSHATPAPGWRWMAAPAYEAYLERVRADLPPDAVILGNLSAGFAFEGYRFYDIRNLAPVGDTVPDPAAYLAERGINTVFWYDEYDYILRNPQWRILYEAEPDTANPADSLPAQAPFLAELKAYLDTHGTLTRRFQTPVYGTRIIRYMGEGDWNVSVFTLPPAATDETPPAP
jgi:hypothetical protein